MAISQIQINKVKFKLIVKRYQNNQMSGQRLGKLFHETFKLDRVSEQSTLLNLYAKDGIQAIRLMRELFNLD